MAFTTKDGEIWYSASNISTGTLIEKRFCKIGFCRVKSLNAPKAERSEVNDLGFRVLGAAMRHHPPQWFVRIGNHLLDVFGATWSIRSILDYHPYFWVPAAPIFEDTKIAEIA